MKRAYKIRPFWGLAFAISAVCCPAHPQDLRQLLQAAESTGAKILLDASKQPSAHRTDSHSGSESGNSAGENPLSRTTASQSLEQKTTLPAISEAAQIADYDIAGVKLGMSEHQAKTNLRLFYPASYTDFQGFRRNLVFQDYTVNNPDGGRPVKAGFFAFLERKDPRDSMFGHYDFVWVLIHQDKIWGIMRYEQSRPFSDYDKTIPGFIAKYPGAQQLTSEDGSVYGVRLHQGNCSYPPLQHHADDRDHWTVMLGAHLIGNTCQKFFQYRTFVEKNWEFAQCIVRRQLWST